MDGDGYSYPKTLCAQGLVYFSTDLRYQAEIVDEQIQKLLLLIQLWYKSQEILVFVNLLNVGWLIDVNKIW